ncbi:neurogenic locus notch homolog protein 1-like [Patiria miniata]|uniref:Uncharacterized protein n=1 Tax=Patiria miniata TaxID=46514 RepID=A0A914ART4_PATMI|nr:neurogenic locus notch homolog protein 1-like [Patiria miniata]
MSMYIKSGECPPPTGAGICVEACSSDSSCPDRQKCCSNGCGHVCTTPVPVSVDVCQSAPCQNGGICTSFNGSYTCHCTSGFTGFNCQTGTGTDYCSSHPCLNGGRCVSSANSYQCDCTPGYVGVRCDIEINECASNPCLNGGVCSNGVGRYVCSCRSVYTGTHCEVYGHTSTTPSPTPERPGQCPAPTGAGICVEACSSDSSCPNQQKCCSNGCGHACVNPVSDVCNPNPCLNGGNCYQSYTSPGSYTCICADGFYGSNCETSSERPGQCPPPTVFGICVEACSSDSSCPDRQKCCSNGCGHACTTPVPVSVDVCQSAPCQNGGICTSFNGSYTCHCTSGFTGFNCQTGTGTDYCSSHPCLNGGRCVSSANSYQCDCTPGYVGVRCDTGINECASNPCLNGGVCSDGVGRYVCSCRSVYTGTHCEVYGHTSTTPSPTPERPGQCPPPTGAGICVEACSSDSSCPEPQKCCSNGCGHACLNPVSDICNPNPCLNGGNCYQSYTSPGSYTCICADGFYGSNCETSSERPGQCPPPTGAGICVEACSSDSSCPDRQKCCSNGCGHACTTPVPVSVDVCQSAPCQNGGICTSFNGSYTCHCTSGFTGFNCQTGTGTDYCSSHPCLNGGLCVSTTNSYQCDCTPGYVGVRCDIGINECASNPCLNGGVCSNGVGRYVCSCRSVYTGTHCEVYGHTSTTPSPTPERPGQCPPPTGAGICVEACSSDSSCPDRQKCCSNGCGHACINPAPDVCNPNPCLNGGNCYQSYTSPGSYTCFCAAGFYGSNCETSSERPGQCPPPTGAGICVEACSSDSSCPDRQKCCLNGCGHVCTTPVPVSVDVCQSAPCQNGGICTSFNGSYTCHCTSGFTGFNCQTGTGTERPGQCPPPTGAGICIEACSSDSSCPDRQKCCSNGCGHACLNPVSERPGQCPAPTSAGICVEACSSDSSCPDRQKCCSNGCGHACVNPVSDVCNPNPCLNGGICLHSNTTLGPYTCFCAAGFYGSNCETSSERPGQCPAPTGAGICVEACSSDSLCPEPQKCCSNGCGHACVNPVSERPGQCPAPTGAGICVEACSSDSSCPDRQKCCSNGCGHVCANPVSERPGQCPAPTGAGICVEACSSDSLCPDRQKCCSNGCGHVCVIPVSDVCNPNPCLNGGICQHSNTTLGPYTCVCADGFYGANCETSSERPGQCPAPTGAGICVEACSSDSSCPDRQKCCSNGCGHGCVNPAPDICNPNPCLNGGNCQRVETLPESYTCICPDGFYGSNCETSSERPGECPQIMGAGICIEACSSDSLCPDRQKCCSNGCGHVCANPVSERPGQCPAPTGAGICVEACSSDSSCPDRQKCCSNGCGHACVNPVSERPGQCPAPTGAGICVEACSSDSSCPDRQKCCSNGCGHACVNPVSERPGQCPAPTGAGICVEACSSDSLCPDRQKCCSNGCGHVCANPAPVDHSPPEFSRCPANIVRSIPAGNTGVRVTWSELHVEDDSGETIQPIQVEGPLSGSVFQPGTHRITYEAQDSARNTAVCTFQVEVTTYEVRDVPPSIVCPPDITNKLSAGKLSAVITWDMPTVLLSSGPARMTYQSMESGSRLGPGKYTVYYRYTDDSNLQGSCSFTITITASGNPKPQQPGQPDKLGGDGQELTLTIVIGVVALVVVLAVVMLIGLYMYNKRKSTNSETSSVGSGKGILKGQNSTEEPRYSKQPIGQTHEIA